MTSPTAAARSETLPIFGAGQVERECYLYPKLRSLTEHHISTCEPYRHAVKALFPDWRSGSTLEELPFLPVGVFKHELLSSVAQDEVFKTVVSSGTTGTQSRVVLDRPTAQAQARTLSLIMSHVLGKQRRPMLIVDTDAVVSNPAQHTARAAGVLGMMGLGRKHVFLLDAEMREQPDRLAQFLDTHADQDLVIFGFTFMVWQHLYKAFAGKNIDLSRACLIHSGGWKTLEDQRVDNVEFKASLQKELGLSHVVNFYGMAEQVGSVYVEGEDGRLHPSREAEILIRDPNTLEVLPPGEMGLIQVMSTLPMSYPGHSILTEDLGVVDEIDSSSSSLGGKSFRVIRRISRSEIRGCSDTYASARAA